MKKILVVDDSSVQRKMMISTLKKAGFNHETLEACDGEEAIDMLGLNHEEILCVICDYFMPKMSGLDFAHGAAQSPVLARIPIIVVSIESVKEDVVEAAALNPNIKGFLHKPFTPEELKQSIDSILP